MASLEVGKVQIYTGDGKGKTTAAVGLAVRAAGAGLRVAFLQFDKGGPADDERYSERRILRAAGSVDVHGFGADRILGPNRFRFANTEEDFAQARAGLALARELVEGRRHDVVICDEAVSCVASGLLSQDELMGLVGMFLAARGCELVLTGRGAFAGLLDAADLVSEVRAVRHYFSRGDTARRGIDY